MSGEDRNRGGMGATAAGDDVVRWRRDVRAERCDEEEEEEEDDDEPEEDVEALVDRRL